MLAQGARARALAAPALAKGLGMKAKMAKALQPKELIVGNVASGWKPVRNPQSKVSTYNNVLREHDML